MDRLILEYLPVILRTVPEFAALMAAEQPELEGLWTAQDDVLANQFLLSATDYGIRRWERILKIYPKDTDGLEMRRARVLAVLRLKLPYTLRWLRGWLDDLCGAGNYGLAITDYLIDLDLGFDGIPEAEKLAADIVALLQAVKPANMILDFNSMRRSYGTLVAGGVALTALTVDVYPARQQLESRGGPQIAGYTEYVAVLDAYPTI